MYNKYSLQSNLPVSLSLSILCTVSPLTYIWHIGQAIYIYKILYKKIQIWREIQQII